MLSLRLELHVVTMSTGHVCKQIKDYYYLLHFINLFVIQPSNRQEEM